MFKRATSIELSLLKICFIYSLIISLNFLLFIPSASDSSSDYSSSLSSSSVGGAIPMNWCFLSSISIGKKQTEPLSKYLALGSATSLNEAWPRSFVIIAKQLPIIFWSRIDLDFTCTLWSSITPGLSWTSSSKMTKLHTRLCSNLQPLLIVTSFQMMLSLIVTLSWILQPSPITELTMSVFAPISECLPITHLSEIVELICLLTSLLKYLLKVATL